MHSDCFEFFSQRCNIDDALDYLWVLTAWRTPWRQAPNHSLQETAVEPDLTVFDDLGISSMRLLPTEIHRMIHEYSATSIVWRFNAASDVIRRLPVALSDDLVSMPLCAVSAWKRGGQPVPVTTELAHKLPVIRLTVDAWGIQEIERLSGNPQFRRWRTDDLVFVIIDQRWLPGINLQFKVKSPS